MTDIKHFKCCEHCDEDPAYHEANEPDTHDLSCGHKDCVGMELADD